MYVYDHKMNSRVKSTYKLSEAALFRPHYMLKWGHHNLHRKLSEVTSLVYGSIHVLE